MARRRRTARKGGAKPATRRTTSAAEQQAAAAEILRVISQSPSDVQPVFDAIVRSARRLCNSVFSIVLRFDGEYIHLGAEENFNPEARAAYRRWFPRRAVDDHLVGRCLLERRVMNVADVTTAYRFVAGQQEQGFRSVLFVPMIRDGVGLGVIGAARLVVGPFPDDQVELLRTFADQAVIAIENARLFTEIQEKNTALTVAHAQVTESLERQTATSDILHVISSSPTAVQPVFDAIAASATRLCHGLYGLVFRFDGQMITLAAEYGSSPDQLKAVRDGYPRPPGRGSVAAMAILERRVIAIADAQSGIEFPNVAERAKAIGYRSILSVPMLLRDTAIGAINVVRVEAAPFTRAQIELLKTFADQAVIAIENVRLFTELQERNREIELQSQALAAASQHKSEFLANMSHELRTPLNAIIGFSEVLAERMFGELNDKQDEYLRDIHASGQHLLSLINDILDLSKIEAGRMELEPADFDLPGAVDNALILVRERAGRRGITLGCDVDERVGTIHGDERKVKQVLLNLLSNAIKFTPEGGRVDVRVGLNAGLAEVSVTDTGIGIAPEDQEAVFEEFKQVGSAAKKVEGTGLGLALARKFVELHGGRLWVKSRLGEGATFTFTVPVPGGVSG
jgi:signal transduction histidine kinase